MQKLLIRKLLNTALFEIDNGRMIFARGRLAELRNLLPQEHAATLADALHYLGTDTTVAVECIKQLLQAIPATYGLIPAGTEFSYTLDIGAGAVAVMIATKRKAGVETCGQLGEHFAPDLPVVILN